ncbi:MAG TPA: hypothetical protein VM123_11815 [archaeon]|nr:hypothetical protein [archaeon]
MSRKAGFNLIFLAFLFACIAAYCARQGDGGWVISALPGSVRLDPASGKIIEDRPDIYTMTPLGDLLEKNWVYDSVAVKLYAARGEYVSFQLVIERTGDDILKDIYMELPPFASDQGTLQAQPELFLEWSVKVTTKSSGYEIASYGPGWYPDALIPLECLQTGPDKSGSLIYPLCLPDFRNRIDNQRYCVIWVDQFVPFEREKAAPGIYRSEIRVTINGRTKKIPVTLKVWDFALPNANTLAGNLQQGGFMRQLDENLELSVYQLLKKHRIAAVDQSYRPQLSVTSDGRLSIDWADFDRRLEKYLTGEAFTAKYGYSGPGYGEPLEWYMLPFNCWSDHRGSPRPGWPDVGTKDEERKPANRAIYLEAIRQVREHVLTMVNPQKTRLVIFLNGLDESYFPEAWDRMVYYGKMFKEHFPEARHRVDGGYSQEAMETIHEAIDYWCCHSVGYNMETVEAYRKLGVTDWVYGPVLYERRGNSGVGSSTFIDLELTNERAISWACWKYRTLTWCSWGIGSEWNAAWYSPETWKHAISESGKPLRYSSYNGNALEVYPPGIVPGVNRPCPTIRLKNMRDGVEEYELMKILAGLDGNSERADRVVDKIINKPFGKQSVGNLDVWSHDPQAWDAARIELGEMIEKAAK